MMPQERWFRTRPDSSVLDRPRLLARSLIDAAQLDDHVAYYERLLATPADLRMPIPDSGGLELAAVGNLMIIGNARPFTPIQRKTAYSLIVPSLVDQMKSLSRLGATVVAPPEPIAPGSRARVRYPDGVIAELVEHRPRPGERPARPPAPLGPAAPPGPCRTPLFARHVVPSAVFAATTSRYAALLGAPCAPCTGLGSPGVSLATVGELLIVGSDELSAGHASPPRVALVRPSAAATGLLQDCPVVERDAGRSLVRLPTGALAEIWHEAAAGR